MSIFHYCYMTLAIVETVRIQGGIPLARLLYEDRHVSRIMTSMLFEVLLSR